VGRLTYYDADTNERHVRIDAMAPEVIIGRSPDCHVSVNMASISRRHASVTFDVVTGACRVDDLGSSNGVVVNGARVQNQLLRDRDDIVLGGFQLTYFEDRPAPGQPAQPSPASQQAPLTEAIVAFGGAAPPGTPGQPPAMPPPSDQAPPPRAQAPPVMPPAPVPYPSAPPPQPGASERVGILEAELTNALTKLANAPSQEALDQAQARVAQLEADNRNLRLGLETAMRERDELNARGGAADPQQLELLRRDVLTAQAQLREVDTALTRALKLLEQLTSGVTL
jgi:pSer/pThr/pTyr-binding forkhead associated (FHA) protein